MKPREDWSKKLTISDTDGADLEIRWDPPLVSTGLDTEYLSTGQGQIILNLLVHVSKLQETLLICYVTCKIQLE